MTIEEIKNKFRSLGLLQEEATFELYGNGLFTYHLYKDDGTFYEISLVNNHKLFRKKEKVCDLINDEGTGYLKFAHYKQNGPDDESLIGDRMELKLSDFIKTT